MDLVSGSNHLHQRTIYHSSLTNMTGLEDLHRYQLLTSVVVVVLLTGLAWASPYPASRYIGNRYFVKDFTLLDNLMFRLLVITSLSGQGGRRDTGGGGGG